MTVKDRIDPLIEERAPWVYRPGLHIRLVRGLLHMMLGYDKTLRIAETLEDLLGPEMMDRLADLIALNVEATGLEHVPDEGPAMIVCNHPTGIADGIMLYHMLAPLRPDLFFYANADILRVLPQLSDMIAPVEWRQDKRSHGKTRETMAYTRDAVAQDRLGVIFPSGRLAKRRGLRLYERPWMASAAMIARKYDLPVIPIHIQARNSALFYMLDLIHPTLRDITLFHETLNKDTQPFRIRVGRAIPAADLPKSSEDGIAMLRKATLQLAEDPEGRVVMRPRWVDQRA